MAFKKVLIDTNICIDAVIARKPFAANALHIINLSESGKVEAYVSAHTFDTIFYVLRKKIPVKKCYSLLRELRSVFKVASVSEEVIDAAIHAEWPDFENAIHYQTALAAGCDAIVTRNPNDFHATKIPVISPEQFLVKF